MSAVCQGEEVGGGDLVRAIVGEAGGEGGRGECNAEGDWYIRRRRSSEDNIPQT